jgi:hypothetical protein
MARLSDAEIHGFGKTDGETWDEHYSRTGKALDALAAASAEIPEGGDVKGAFLKFSVADGYAHYVVTASSPLTVAHVPYGDSYKTSAAAIRGLTVDEVRQQLRARRARDLLDKKNDDFYESLEVGQTVHYDHGFGAYVRCEVVLGSHDGESVVPRKVLRSVALVGNWREYDLPRREPDGSITWGYQVEKIRDRSVFHPHESCIWESPRCAGRGRHVQDPYEMEPVDVSGPPPMDEEGEEAARLWRLVGQVRSAAGAASDPRACLLLVKRIAQEAGV